MIAGVARQRLFPLAKRSRCSGANVEVYAICWLVFCVCGPHVTLQLLEEENKEHLKAVSSTDWLKGCGWMDEWMQIQWWKYLDYTPISHETNK